jgi:hypothetical protein
MAAKRAAVPEPFHNPCVHRINHRCVRVAHGLLADAGRIEEGKVMLGTILLIVLIIILLGAIPTWPYSRNWGYGPSGLTLVLVILLVVLLATGRI